MKVEKRDKSTFISHNGLTIFFNKRSNNQEEWFNINITMRGEEDHWHKIGEIDVKPDNINTLIQYLNELTHIN